VDDHTQPWWGRLLLHATLIVCSIIFLLPYAWLVGTSWKLDKELRSETVRILPQRPIPRVVGPYVDERTYRFVRPDDAPEEVWSTWMAAAIEEEIGRVVDAWSPPDGFELPADVLRQELIEGVFNQVRTKLPKAAWTSDEPRFRMALREAVAPQLVADAFEQCYRFLALGKVVIKDMNYRVHDVTRVVGLSAFWRAADGPVEIRHREFAEGPLAVLHYDFSEADRFEVATEFQLPMPFTDFKRVSIGFRRDQSWHELRALIEVNGRLYRSASPKYLGEDSFLEDVFQLPGPDDRRLAPRHYVLLEEIDHGAQYDHGQDVMRLRVQISQSSHVEALWAKGTENYREVFAEVPFWRYLSNSAFLALANIIGTCLSCSLAAYAFARLKFPGRDLCFVLVLATMMIPPQVTMIPSFVIYKQLGWYNTLAPLWVPSCLAINGFAIFLLRQAMKGLPRDLEDAAKIDGCGYFRIYWHVALPLMKPTLAAISVFVFMYVWNDFMGPLIYVNDQRLYPLALGLFSFMAGREALFTLVMAGSVVMTLPVIIMFFLLQRYFIQGVTLTGMKG